MKWLRVLLVTTPQDPVQSPIKLKSWVNVASLSQDTQHEVIIVATHSLQNGMLVLHRIPSMNLK